MASRSPAILNLHKRVEAISGIGSILTRMIPVGVLVLYFIHLQACVLFYFGKVTGFMTWDAQFSHWQLFEGGISASSEAERYIWMLSQSVGNMFQTTFKPETLPEQILTMIFIIIGAFMYAVLVGLISSAAISYDASGRLYRQKIDQLTEYLSWKNVDAETRKKLLGYYEFKYKGKYFEETGIFKDMNESLRRQLASLNCKQLIEKVPFLKRECLDGRDGLYLGKIATALVPIYFVTGDSIIEQGEQATDMFFILTGRVNVLVNDHAVTTISDGGFFGEVALIANIPRTASVKAATNCYCYSLSAKDFYAIIVEFPDVRVRIDKIYEERMAKVRMEQAARLFMGGEKLSGSLRASPTPSVRRTFNE
ncbi:cyclic nucleotide-binding-like protein [Chytriomyces sp. MP71]|nr:cyclic nucleotide-binding-like protein [Chytriomyces sp. MP71]